MTHGGARQFTFTKYPGERKGWVIESKQTLQQMKDDDGLDAPSRGEPVSLPEHIENVEREAFRLASAVLPPEIAEAVRAAARWHDAGKADERFQALLFGGDTIAAQLSPVSRAKGEFTPRSKRQEQRDRSGLPDGFRHELTSLLLAEQTHFETEHRDLILHLVASHHGYCRPFAPVILDDGARDTAYGGAVLTAAERQSRAAHVLDRGVAERFWGLTRRYGWWGLAYLESLLRLADWKVSADEQKKRAAERTP
jgi:CRISPR-associated endonuclease/helicase Cas3